MGCGLRKLEEPEDSSPGKIYSSLKRPQVETRTDSAYEYVLLDFSLEGRGRPQLMAYCWVGGDHTDGTTHTHTHPVMRTDLSHTITVACSVREEIEFGPPRAAAARVPPSVLSGRGTRGQGQPHRSHRVVQLEIKGADFLPGGVALLAVIGEGRNRYLTRHTHRPVTDRVSSTRGGAEPPGGTEYWLHRPVAPRRWCSGLSISTAGQRAAAETHGPYSLCHRCPAGEGTEGSSAGWCLLDIRDLRAVRIILNSKGRCWHDPHGEPVPRSLEGLFVYEEPGPSLTPPVANDTIVVEQWTVIEGSEVKADYGPLIHTLAEFSWLLTCVLPTPIIRHDSEGNLATKQVVFLQRPVRCSEPPPRRPQAGSPCSAASAQPMSPGVGALQAEELSPCSGVTGGFAGFGGGYPSVLTELEEGGFEQDEGVAQVTCM
ncbi:RFTN2 protein, partial [Atractosteus spatula]|nr:RFTN2 protein [Atractosteus spatula]